MFPLEGISAALTDIAAVNPLSYGVDGLRQTVISASGLGLFADFAVLIAVSAVFFAIGVYLFSKIEV